MSSPKVVIVTGASRGIGLAIAKYIISQKSHKLVLTARSLEPLKNLQNEAPDSIEVLDLDMAQPGVGKIIAEQTIQKFGRIDGLVINHGILDPVKKVADSFVDEWKKTFNINFFSGIELIQESLPHLRKSKGKIIITSSGAATSAYTGWGAYGATKAALNHLTMTLGVEERDVVSIAIRPGTVDTDMQRDLRETHHATMDPKDAKKFADLKRNGGLLRPDQPGNVIAKLVLDAPSSLSGKFLTWNDKALEAFQDVS